MDRDDSLYLAGTASGSNTDDDEIDSDLEDKLYAAVFHSNEVSSQNQEIPGYNNFTTLTDVVNSWKSIPKENNEPLASSEQIAFSQSTKNYDGHGRSFSFNENRYDKRPEIPRHQNRVEESSQRDRIDLYQEFGDDNRASDAVDDNEPGIDLRREKERDFELNRIRDKTTIEEQQEREAPNIVGKESPMTKIMKRLNGSPKKLPNTKDSRVENSPMKYSAQDKTSCETHTQAGSLSAPQEATESSEIKAEDKIEENKSPGEERRQFSPNDENCGRKEASVKPEDEFERDNKSVNENEAVEKESDELAKEEQPGKINSTHNEASNSSTDSSSSDTLSDDSSSSTSNQSNSNIKKTEKNEKKNSPSTNQADDIITLDDSEGSIYEIPVPPKPRPPTINLEDSQSSSSSDEDVMTPEKLVQSYKTAVLESNSNHNSKNEKNRPSSQKRKKSSRKDQNSSSNGVCSSTPDHGDSLTEKGGEIIQNLLPHLESDGAQFSSGFTTDLVSEEGGNMRVRESLTGSSEIRKKTSRDLLSEDSVAVETPFSENRRLLDTRQRSSEAVDRDRGSDDDMLIINAGSIRGLSDFEASEGEEASRRISDSRKRAMSDSGRKSKHHGSPKKAKSSEDTTGISTSPNSKSRKDNRGHNKDKRNFAADYFFKPMNNEMENYYNESWGGENFDVDNIRKQMPRDSRHWAILNEDLIGYQQRKSRYWVESKCRNCNRTGHMMSECPEKRKIPCCHMCGTPGHKEPRCPNKMCLGCGKKQNVYMQVCSACRGSRCNRCESYGHLEDTCPDLWRKYHGTTSHGDEINDLELEDVMKPQHRLSCCNCAKRGHDSTTCKSYRWSRHFATPAFVTDYITGPDYPPEPAEFLFEERQRTENEERNSADTTQKISSKKKRRRKKLDQDIVDASQSGSKDLDANDENAGELKDSNQDKNQDISNEDPQINSEATQDEELLLTFKSNVSDDNFKRAANFGQFSVQLLARHYNRLADDMGRSFLQNLTSKFPMQLEIKRDSKKDLIMQIASTTDLHFPLQQVINDWLKWPFDERSRFVEFSLPMIKEDLVKLLNEKLNELEQDLGNPFALDASIRNLKNNLSNLRMRKKKIGLSTKRASTAVELAKSQCRLNMILFGQAKIKKSVKSLTFLKNALSVLKKSDTDSQVSASTYLQLVHHYNKIFAAYTPENIKELLLLYRNVTSDPRKKFPTRNSDSSEVEFVEVINTRNNKEHRKTASPKKNSSHTKDPVSSKTGNENQESKSSKRIAKKRSKRNSPQREKKAKNTKLMKSLNEENKKKKNNNAQISLLNYFNTGNIALQQNLNNYKGGSGFNSGRNESYNGVEGRFIAPEIDSNNANHSIKQNFPPASMDLNLRRLENAYYNNPQQNLGDNSSQYRRGGEVFGNSRQDDYIALDARNLNNEFYNSERYDGSLNQRIRRYGTRSNINQRIENNNIQNNNAGINYTGRNNSTFGRDRWHEDYSLDKISSQDMFFTDTRAPLTFQIYPQNDRSSDNLSRNEFDTRKRYNLINCPSTSTVINDQLGVNYDNQTVPSNDKNEVLNNNKDKSRNNKNKKKKISGSNLPPHLQKRVAENLIKYINGDNLNIRQAAKAMQKKLDNKELTLQRVTRFERLLKRHLKKNDYLL